MTQKVQCHENLIQESKKQINSRFYQVQHLIDDLDHTLPFLRYDQYLRLADGAVYLDQSELVQRLDLVAHSLRPRYVAVDIALHHR